MEAGIGTLGVRGLWLGAKQPRSELGFQNLTLNPQPIAEVALGCYLIAQGDGIQMVTTPETYSRDRCNNVVRQVLTRYRWELVSYETLVREVLACIAQGEAKEPWAATINTYCRHLYAACSGAEGLERQELGLTELYRYLYELSFRDAHDIPADLRQEAANEALLRIWQKLSRYRKPGALLAIAAFELRSVIRPWWSHRTPLSLDTLAEQTLAGDDNDLDERAINRELQESVKRCFDETLRRHPRARQQLEAVWLKFVAQLDDATISDCIGKPVTSVHVLRSRGLNHLRRDPSWQSIARELGML